MRINTKKILCPNCQKLVIGNPQSVESTIKVSCPICKEVIWLWDGIKWLQIRK